MSHGLYMDVHIQLAVTEGLRRRGVDVLTSQDDGTREADDEVLLQRASDLNRILVTQDLDFCSIAADWQTTGRPFAGLVFAHQLGPGIGRIIDDLELLAKCAEREELQDRILHLPLR